MGREEQIDLIDSVIDILKLDSHRTDKMIEAHKKLVRLCLSITNPPSLVESTSHSAMWFITQCVTGRCDPGYAKERRNKAIWHCRTLRDWLSQQGNTDQPVALAATATEEAVDSRPKPRFGIYKASSGQSAKSAPQTHSNTGGLEID